MAPEQVDSGLDGHEEVEQESSRNDALESGKAEGSNTDRQAAEVTASPVPPLIADQPVQVALGMQLIQQNAFDRLDPKVQMEIINLARTMDKHAFENAQESLRRRQESQEHQLEVAAKGRKNALLILALLAILGLVAGTAVTLVLLFQEQYQLGHTVMMSGLAVVSALVGGAGLTSLFRHLSQGE